MMQIDLPEELVTRLRQRAAIVGGLSEADVIRQALSSLEWHESERDAIQAGVDAVRQGRVRPFDEFDHEFCAKNDIVAER